MKLNRLREREIVAQTQPAKKMSPVGRTLLLAASVALLLLAGNLRPATAQQTGTNQAGLVIQFGDGQLYTACVDLGDDGQATAEEVLRASGLLAIVDYNSGFGGGTVCKIGDQGCNFPAEKCFCQCTMKPGDPCVYWTYFHLLDGQWRYSNLGVSDYIVKPGDVEGWAWGAGTVNAGTQPPVVPFEQLCAASSPAPPPTTAAPAPATSTPLPPPPTFTPTPLPPTATPAPTRTPPPSLMPTSRPGTSTPSPRPEATVTVTVTATDTRQPTLTASATPSPRAAAAGNETPSPTPTVSEPDTMALPTPGSSDGSGGAANVTNYVLFGALAVILVIGLIVLQGRQKR